MNEVICNKIQTSISLWRYDLKTVIENNEILYSSGTNSYYWLSFDRLKQIISMNPYDHLDSEKTGTEKKRQFLIDNKQRLCWHGGLHTMIAIRDRYIPGNVYNHIKITFIEIW